MNEIELHTFEELHNFTLKWANGELKDNILVVGDGGLGKSYAVKEIPDVLRFDGHMTPFRAFQLGYQQPHYNIIWDDMDDIFKNKQMVKLLKQFCELDNPKHINFGTTRQHEAEENYPFYGYNMVIMNDIRKVGKNLKALLTRFLIVKFVPSRVEVLRQLKEFATERDILDEMKTWMQYIRDFNFRVYVHLERLKKASMNWKGYFYKSIHPRFAEIHSLLSNYKTDKERIEHFSGGKTQYYYWKKKFGGLNNEKR
jgi:hypothetical protein